MSTTSAPPLGVEPLARAAPAREVPRFSRVILASGLGLGVLADVIFDGHALGISVPLYVAALLGALLRAGGHECRQQARPSLWLIAPAMFFAAMVAVLESALLTALNLMATVGLLLLLSDAYAGERVHQYALARYFSSAARALGGWLSRPPRVIYATVDLRGARAWAEPRARPIVRGLLLALPVMAVFVLLLSSADLKFQHLIERLFSARSSDLLATSAQRAAIVLGGGFLAAGVLAHALRRRTWEAPSTAERVPSGLGFIEGATLLVCVDLLFGLFVLIQFAYLFGGSARLAETDVTYANYARRGFFELLAVALLSLALIHALSHFVSRAQERERARFNALCTAMVALVVIILASAIMRMSLYEEAYGYTRLRVYTHVFMLTLIPLLAWRAITLWLRKDRFAIGLLVAGLACVGALDLLNPDAFIAARNLDRATTTSGVDVEYLASLSSDALPTLGQALADGRLGAQGGALRTAVCEGETRPSTDDTSWPALHLGRLRARRVLANLCACKP